MTSRRKPVRVTRTNPIMVRLTDKELARVEASRVEAEPTAACARRLMLASAVPAPTPTTKEK